MTEGGLQLQTGSGGIEKHLQEPNQLTATRNCFRWEAAWQR